MTFKPESAALLKAYLSIRQRAAQGARGSVLTPLPRDTQRTGAATGAGEVSASRAKRVPPKSECSPHTSKS